MTQHRARTSWGTGVHREQVAVRVDPATKAKINAAADAVELSQSLLVDALMQLVDVDDAGRVWVGAVELTAPQKQEELPMTG